MTLDYQKTKEFEELNRNTSPFPSPQWDLTSPLHPLDKELALFASHAYSPNKLLSELAVAPEWVVLARGSAENGYNGVAYWRPDRGRLVISHCGTEHPLPALTATSTATPAWWNVLAKVYQSANALSENIRRIEPTIKDLMADYVGIVHSAEVAQIGSALEFVGKVLADINSKGLQSLSITGHSLGGWLAQITTYELSRRGAIRESMQFSGEAHCVVFDSPGAKQIIETSERYVTADHKLDLTRDLNIVTYLSAPNLVNTCHVHLGSVYRIFPDLPGQATETSLARKWAATLLQAHTIDNFCQFFTSPPDSPLRLEKVVKWPQIDWTKMNPSTSSVAQGLWHYSTGRASSIENFLATVAQLDATQFTILDNRFKAIEGGQVTTPEDSFEQVYMITRQGNYETAALSQGETLSLPAQRFGADYPAILSALQAYRALVHSGLLAKDDVAAVTHFKSTLQQKLLNNGAQLEALVKCVSGEETGAIKINRIASGQILKLSPEEIASPRGGRYIEYQFTQVARHLFRVYPTLAQDLHQIHLNLPTQLLDGHQELKKALEKLEQKMEESPAEKKSYRINNTSTIVGEVTNARFNAFNADKLPPDKELVGLITKFNLDGVAMGINNSRTVAENASVETFEDNIGNLDFATSHSSLNGDSEAQKVSSSSTPALTPPILTQFDLPSPREGLEQKMEESPAGNKSHRINNTNTIVGKVANARFNAFNANNLPPDNELVRLITKSTLEGVAMGINNSRTVAEKATVGTFEDNIGNFDFATSHSSPNGGSEAQKVSSSSTPTLIPPILTQYDLLSPRESIVNIRLFLKNAARYHDMLQQETDEDIVEMREELADLLMNCKKELKGVDKAKREEIRVKIKEIEEIREFNRKYKNEEYKDKKEVLNQPH